VDIRYRLLSTSEAARLVGVNDSRIRQMIRAGELPAQKVTRDWLIRPEDVEAFLAKPRRGPGRPRKLVRGG
jgi:excisionase family DNA binding protein